MAKSRTYKSHTISNAGGGFQDWRCTFIENGAPRVRFGTLEEIKADIDLVTSGCSLPAPERGYA